MPSCGFIDVQELLPNNLEQQDIEKLVDCSKSVHSCLRADAHLVSGVYLLSEDLLVKAKAVAKKSGTELAEADLIAGKRTVPLGRSAVVESSGEYRTSHICWYSHFSCVQLPDVGRQEQVCTIRHNLPCMMFMSFKRSRLDAMRVQRYTDLLYLHRRVLDLRTHSLCL